MKFREEEKSK